MSNIPVIKFTFKKDWKALSEALLSKTPFTSEDFTSANELATYLSTVPGCLVFASLEEKEDLIQLATLVKVAKKVAKDTVLKVVVVNFSGNKQFEKAIQKLGLLDVVEPSINTKGLRFKIDFYMKSIIGQMKSNTANSEMKTVKSSDAKNADKKVVSDQTPNWLDPMDCEDDIWLLKKEIDCKKVLGRWLIRLTGPGPGVAQWADIRGKTNAWKFEFKADERQNFINGSGTWYFQGDMKPEFVWKENVWLLTGSSFELFYYENEKKIPRLCLKDKVLEFCKNSEYAKTKEQLIIESFDKEHVFKKDADKIKTNAEIEGEAADRFSNLKGKGKTDHIEQGNLEGETDGTDNIDSNPMSMDVNPNDNKLGSPQLSHKSSNDKLDANWDGKSSTDAINNRGLNAPVGGAHKEGALLDMDNNKSEHQTYYKGHNETEKFEAKELNKNKYQENAKGPVSGKTSTDHIPKFYNKEGEQIDRDPNPEVGKDDNYGGKSSTDKIATHYGAGGPRDPVEGKEKADPEESTLSPKASKERQEKERESNPESELSDKPLSGASSTEKLKSHYGHGGNGETSEEEKKSGPMAGASSTDKVASHLRSPNSKKNQSSEEDSFEASEFINQEAEFSGDSLDQDDSDKIDLDEVEEDGVVVNHRNQEKVRTEKTKSERVTKEAKVKEEKSAGADVISLSEAREKNKKQQSPAPEVEKDIRIMIEDAKVTSVLSQGAVMVSCHLEDFFDNTLIFTTGKSALLSQQQIKLEMKFNYQKKLSEIAIEAFAKSIENDEEGNQFIIVEMQDKDVANVTSFMKLYELRQVNIDLFLRKAKGL